MRIPSESELISLWERGLDEHPVDRALTLLSACSHESREAIARLSVGNRDARLLEAYERLYGSALDAFVECPACSERLEYGLSTRDLRLPAPTGEAPQLQFDNGNISLRLRLPDSLDLLTIRNYHDPERAGRALMERCIVAAFIDAEPVPFATLPAQLEAAVASALAAADPQAEILIDLTCSSCSHQWQVTLDIERFLWTKISATAKRLLREVHALASAYGWREQDILALSPTRRQTYTEMAWRTS